MSGEAPKILQFTASHKNKVGSKVAKLANDYNQWHSDRQGKGTFNLYDIMQTIVNTICKT